MLFAGDWPWWLDAWYGICNMGIAAGMIFWSHFYRRNPLQHTPGFIMHIGHFIYFALACVFGAGGLTLVVGGFRRLIAPDVVPALTIEYGILYVLVSITLVLWAFSLDTTRSSAK